jgi:hypothetical protein
VIRTTSDTSLHWNEQQELPSIWHEIELPPVLGLNEPLNRSGVGSTLLTGSLVFTAS